jgi:hypothetical protein
VKSGGASLSKGQRIFDAVGRDGAPAVGTLNGQKIQVTSVFMKDMP